MLWVFLALLYVRCSASIKLNASLPLHNIRLPPGFKIDLYSSENLTNARELCLSTGTNGNTTIVYVSTRTAAKVLYFYWHLPSSRTTYSSIPCSPSYWYQNCFPAEDNQCSHWNNAQTGDCLRSRALLLDA